MLHYKLVYPVCVTPYMPTAKYFAVVHDHARLWTSPPLPFTVRPSVRHSVCKASSQTANSTAPQNTRISWRLFHKNVTPVGTPQKRAITQPPLTVKEGEKGEKRKEKKKKLGGEVVVVCVFRPVLVSLPSQSRVIGRRRRRLEDV
jgi:hypothetical protein